jgi:serine protease Do
MKPRRLSRSLSTIFLLLGSPAFAQSISRPAATTGLLKELNASVEGLTERVALSVVQVLASGYGSVRAHARRGRSRDRPAAHRGSGPIVDPDGYIITNAHVVAGARQVQVVVHRDTTADGPMRSLALIAGQTVDARVVGTATDFDLALLKVDLTGLQRRSQTTMPPSATRFAFGGPEGLRNSGRRES